MKYGTWNVAVGRTSAEVIGWCWAGLVPCRVAGTGRYRIPRRVAEEVLQGKRLLPDDKPARAKEGEGTRKKTARALFGAATLLTRGVPGAQHRALVGLIEEAADELAEGR